MNMRGGIDNTPMANMMLALHAAVGELERSLIVVRLGGGKEHFVSLLLSMW